MTTFDASRSQRERLPRRPTQVESAGRVSLFHLQSIRLQAQEHEWSDYTVALETGRNSTHVPPRLPDNAEIKPSSSSKNRPGSGTLSSTSRGPTIRWRNRKILKSVLASTLGFSSTRTTQTEPPSNRLTSQRNANGSNVHNVTSRGRNTGLRIGRNSAELWPSVTLS